MHSRLGRRGLVMVMAIGGLVACESGAGEDATVTPTDVATTIVAANEGSDDGQPPSTPAAPTDEAASATYPNQESVATDTPAGWNRAGGFAVGLNGDTGEVVAIDLATGAVDQSLARVDIEARWYGRFQLDWAGTAVFFHVQTEDHWFSCDSSPGTIYRLDFASGEQTLVALGAEPQVSPDGSHLAYLTASQCLPDPDDPGNFVLTPYDSVVVRDLATGAEQTWIDLDRQAANTTTEGDLLEAQLSGLAWLGPDELAVSDRRLAVSTLDVVGPGANLGAEAGGVRQVVGFDPSRAQVMVEEEVFIDDSRQARLLGLDPATGEPTIHVKASPALFAFDSQNRNLLVLDNGQLIVDGQEIALQTELDNVDW